MSSNLMQTEAGGESQQYEGNLGYINPHKKSGGQLGDPQTTIDPSRTAEGQQQAADRGAQTSENIRYGQTISETGGMGGMTQGQMGSAGKEGYGGQVGDGTGDAENIDEVSERKIGGYGGEKDMNREVGA